MCKMKFPESYYGPSFLTSSTSLASTNFHSVLNIVLRHIDINHFHHPIVPDVFRMIINGLWDTTH